MIFYQGWKQPLQDFFYQMDPIDTNLNYFGG